MAKIILTNNNQEAEISDNTPIKETCEEKLGIPFGCKNGICGVCKINVTEGIENLSEKNEKEEDMFPNEPNIRLACQSIIKEGVVKINNNY